MNKKRRNVLHAALDDLARLRDPIEKEEVIAILKKVRVNVDKCMNEEEDAVDSLPDSFRWSTRYDDMTENVSDLCEASGELDTIIETCQQAGVFQYDSIKEDIIKTVNLIKRAIDK